LVEKDNAFVTTYRWALEEFGTELLKLFFLIRAQTYQFLRMPKISFTKKKYLHCISYKLISSVEMDLILTTNA
jgi:hypothetical protein